MRKISATKLLEAIEPLVIEISGKEYTCKHISMPIALGLFERLNAIETSEHLTAVVTEICEGAGLPAEDVLALPPMVATEILRSFFEWVRSKPNIQKNGPTPGTSSEGRAVTVESTPDHQQPTSQ